MILRIVLAFPAVVLALSSSISPESVRTPFVHTLLLCRHGDSIWNGGESGSQETFTGWTNVPLSAKGIREAQATGKQVSEFELGIDACFTSILQRAQMTAHYCTWSFADKPDIMSPRRYIQDFRLNERHYGSLQGLVKEDVERGKYGHDPELVQQWRRSWYTVPPLLHHDDPRRQSEVKQFENFCGGPQHVPCGESLDQVANNRIRPFLDQVLCPVLEEAAEMRMLESIGRPALDDSSTTCTHDYLVGGTGLVVAHANSLRALIGVLSQAKNDKATLSKLEALRLQTGVPLVLRFQILSQENGDTIFRVCDLNGRPFQKTDVRTNNGSSILVPELPVYPLSSIPMKSSQKSTLFSKRKLSSNEKYRTVPF